MHPNCKLHWPVLKGFFPNLHNYFSSGTGIFKTIENISMYTRIDFQIFYKGHKESGVLLMSSMDKTMKFNVKAEEIETSPKDVLLAVYDALQEKGYNPINQIVGYLLSGDPAYIPRHNNARSLIRKRERDELIEELVRAYLGQHK